MFTLKSSPCRGQKIEASRTAMLTNGTHAIQQPNPEMTKIEQPMFCVGYDALSSISLCAYSIPFSTFFILYFSPRMLNTALVLGLIKIFNKKQIEKCRTVPFLSD